ncbi:MAG TPA: CRISPR-associated endonuclease Cas3'', partial [Syntrophorhabdus aromaticivorans]|nr:CRISPR-associated endonuclease Cas3'' [Syntrophorhabdus aromaticivorans]
MDHKMMTFNTPTADFKCLWAKSNPRHPLWKHMLDAAAVSLAFSPPFIGSGWKPEATAFLVGLHDVGKADSCFQHQIPDFSLELAGVGYKPTNDARCRHERISARFIKKKLVSDGLDDFTADAIARTVVAHHGYWNETARDVDSQYEEAQHNLCRMLQRILLVETFPKEAVSDLSAFGMRLAGHLVLSDWIASNEEFFCDARLKDIDDPEEYFARAKVLAAEWIDRLGLRRDADTGRASSIVETPRPVQQILLEKDIPPCLVIIEAPMGEGKTEAAWILAEKWRGKGYYGMYMALPTMATSDSLHARYKDDYLAKLNREKDVKLVHGMSWLRDEKEPKTLPQTGEPGDDQSFAAAWFRPTRRAMLAAHGVGTVDQAMLAGMNVKFGFLRLAGLADRVLVIDEVHAYDAYMSAIIVRLLQWCACLKIPVVLLSATLSARQRA